MAKQAIFVFGAIIAALVASFFAGNEIFFTGDAKVPSHPPYISGRNKTALFIVNEPSGLSNVHLATASSLLELYPDIEVHFASFPGMDLKVERIAAFAQKKTPTARGIVFHELKGRPFFEAAAMASKDMDTIGTKPGAAGIGQLCKDLQTWTAPWNADDYLALYNEALELVDEVDPAVVVAESVTLPAVDATRARNRLHALISPNLLFLHFIAHQPFPTKFWKYPGFGSGFPYPVPLQKMAENIYINIRFIYSLVKTPDIREKQAVLRNAGISNPVSFWNVHRDDAPFISIESDVEGASLPLAYLPPNVTRVGPMVIDAAPAVEQDAELVEWLKRAPTVLINLGSIVSLVEAQAQTMAEALADVLSKSNVQVLWKFNKWGEYDDKFATALKPHLDSDRVRMFKWLAADPFSLLETGHIAASVHHGGSGCYHETLGAGVPHVVLPLWIDHYNFATLTEALGVGVWGCRQTSPEWQADCLSEAILNVVDGGEAGAAIREKARMVGDKIKQRGKGSEIAAHEVAKLAYAGTK